MEEKVDPQEIHFQLPSGKGAEKWNIHSKAELLAGAVINIWPMIEGFHQMNIKDIIYVDLSRIHHLVNSEGKIIKERFNTKNPFWTPTNPFPINSISSDEEVLSIWDRKVQGSQNIILTQLKKDVELLIAIKNKSPQNTTLVVVNYVKEVTIEQAINPKYPRVATCLMIQKVTTKPTEQEPYETQMVLTPEPVIIFS